MPLSAAASRLDFNWNIVGGSVSCMLYAVALRAGAYGSSSRLTKRPIPLAGGTKLGDRGKPPAVVPPKRIRDREERRMSRRSDGRDWRGGCRLRGVEGGVVEEEEKGVVNEVDGSRGIKAKNITKRRNILCPPNDISEKYNRRRKALF